MIDFDNLPDGVQRFRAKRDELLVSLRPHKRVGISTAMLLASRPAPFQLPVSRWWRDGEGMGRDSMKSKCYKAEDEARKHPAVRQRIFSEVEDMAEYCRDVMESEWFQRRWPRFHQLRLRYIGNARVCKGGGARFSTYAEDRWASTSQIQISDWGMGWSSADSEGGEMIVLHELAHAICPSREHHGRLWARTFLELVRCQMGAFAGEQLELAFRRYRIRIIPLRQVAAAA